MDKANQIEMRELFLLLTYSGLGLTIRKKLYIKTNALMEKSSSIPHYREETPEIESVSREKG